MSYIVKIPNGILTMCETDFCCPKCGKLHVESDYYKRLSERMLIHKRCKKCKTWLGITTDITGDVQVWLKEDEKKADKLK